MEFAKDKNVLISGASIAGLSAAWWMNNLGYRVTVVEMASEPRVNGAAVDFKGAAVDIIKRMGIFEQLKKDRLRVEKIEFKNADDVTEGSILLTNEDDEHNAGEIEIERDKFISIMLAELNAQVEFVFNNSITALQETEGRMNVTFKNGMQRAFHLVLGCDGLHSVVRRLWFGDENEYIHFLGAYFSITIVNKLLVEQKTMQAYNEPGKGIMLNAYNGKTDIIFCFLSEKEIPYNYRDADGQKEILMEQFAEQGWRTAALLKEAQQSNSFYFDKFCQVKMSSWAKGRVALVGDAGYCASPAAGMGASLSIIGASTLADALQKYYGNLEAAFQDYNQQLHPFIDEVQATAKLNIKENFIPRTEEAIHNRNTKTMSF